MRLGKWVIVGILIMMISVNVNAVPHHVDYDDVDANISIIIHYVQNALYEINLTFEAILADDPANVTVHGDHFVDSVKRVDETLDMIPGSVDSYQTLETFHTGFIRFERNFSLTLSGYLMIIGSIEVFDCYDLSIWNISSIKENLTSVDEAIDEYEEGFDIINEYTLIMRDDLEYLGSTGLNVDEQIDLSSGIIGHMEGNYSGVGREEVADELVSYLVPQWSEGLWSLVNEEEMDNELAERLRILDMIVPVLSSNMFKLLKDRMDLLKAVDTNMGQFHENQTKFLHSIEFFENTSKRPEDLSDQYDLFNSTRNAFNELEIRLEEQWALFQEIDPENGDIIEENLTSLEELLDSYEERLFNISLIIGQLNGLAELISITLEKNVIPADPDLDGQISFDEMRNLMIPAEMWVTMDDMVELEDLLESELTSIGRPWRDEVDLFFLPLSDGIDLTVKFSIDHDNLIDDLVGVTFINETNEILKDKEHMLSAITNLNMMYGTFTELEHQLDVIDGLELDVNMSVLEPLSLLLDQYRDLLERLAGDMNVSGLFLSLDNDLKPYDSYLLLNVLYLRKDAFGGVSYSDNDVISLFLDNISFPDMITIDGLANGIVPITRDMALGDHGVNVSVNSSTFGDLRVVRNFTVRKIYTDMVLTSSSDDVDIDGEVDIQVSVRDEFNRGVRGSIRLDEVEMEIDGMIEFNRTFSTYGDHSIVGNFSGEGYYYNSSDEILIRVRDDPIMSLLIENTTIEIGQMIVGELILEKGEGLLEVTIGEMVIPFGFASNGTQLPFSLNSSILGVGAYRVFASLTGSVSWIRDGVSLYTNILIIENETEDPVVEDPIVEDPVVEDPVVEDPVVEDPVDEDPVVEDLLEEYLNYFEGAPLWKILLVLVMILMVLVVIFVFVRKEWLRSKEERRNRPSIHEVRGPVEIEHVDDPKYKESTRKILKRAAEHLGLKRIDPVRAGVVVKYIDMVEGSPEEIGLKTTLTPRENGSKLIVSGAGKDVSDKVTSTFERCVYHPEPPTEDSIREYDVSVGAVISWYRSLSRDNEGTMEESSS